MLTRFGVDSFLRLLIAALITGTLGGCAEFPRPLMEPSVASVADERPGSIVDNGTASKLDIDAGFAPDDIFMLRSVEESGRVPDYRVKSLSITESGVFDALRLVAKDAGLSLNIDGGAQGSERFGSAAAFDVKGQLKDVLDQLSDAMGFFYYVRKNTLFIQQEQQFVVELPPALSDDNTAGLTNTIQYLGGKEPYIDRFNRSLVFRTNKKSIAKIDAYLRKIRDTRSLIIYDVNVFQVDLADNSNTGVNWNALGWSGTPTTVGVGAAGSSGLVGGTANAVANTIGNAVTATASTLGMGLVLSSSRFTVDMLINFLKTQGSVKAISRPRLAVMSGTKGTLRVGQVTTFISKVGTNYSTSLNTATAETTTLPTGVNLSLFGDYSDRTVYTRIGLLFSEITRMEQVTALGTSFTLPQTADREVDTLVRARPGDMILLGGITIAKDSKDVSRGVSTNGSSDTVTRSELVLTIKAKVVNFKGKDFSAPDPAVAQRSNGPAGGKQAVEAVSVATPVVNVGPSAIASHTVNLVSKLPAPSTASTSTPAAAPKQGGSTVMQQGAANETTSALVQAPKTGSAAPLAASTPISVPSQSTVTAVTPNVLAPAPTPKSTESQSVIGVAADQKSNGLALDVTPSNNAPEPMSLVPAKNVGVNSVNKPQIAMEKTIDKNDAVSPEQPQPPDRLTGIKAAAFWAWKID